jgi:hypothetical protein
MRLCPDLAAGRHVRFAGLALDEWLAIIELHVEALNEYRIASVRLFSREFGCGERRVGE